MRVNNGLTPQELEAYGISDVHDIVYNPSYDLLYQEELDPSLTGYERGVLTNLGAVAVDTGIFTGRSPKDKYIVRDDTTRDTFWWADKGKGKNDNKPLSPETWQHLKGLVTKQLSGKRLFVVDAFCGANPDTRLSVRFITEVAWQAHFVKNMFIRPSDEELAGFKPDFIVMNGAKCTNPQWKEQGLNSENFVAFNLTERMQLDWRHLVRRRNEERDVLNDELPAAAERYRFYALLRQRWRERRCCGVLRPFRHR